MPTPTFTNHRCQGFTLVETIVVMVVVAIAAAGITTMTGNIFTHQDDNKTLQVGMKVAQECAEQVLATHRAGALNKNCSAFEGFNIPVVNDAATYTGNGLLGSPECPTGKTCKIVTITVSTSVGNDSLTPITLFLVGS